MDQQIFLCCRSADGLDATQLSALAKQLAWRALEQMTAQDQPTLQAAGVQLQKESSGRPLFCGTDAFVSITHTTGMAAAAVSALPLGIDIERSSRVSPRAAERMFSRRKKRWMQQTDLAGPRFALLWTLREAYAVDRSGTCRSVPLEARQGKGQLFSCQCTPNSLQRQLLPYRQPAFGGISPLLCRSNRFIPHLL